MRRRLGGVDTGDQAVRLTAPEPCFELKDRRGAFRTGEPFDDVLDQDLQIVGRISAREKAIRVKIVLMGVSGDDGPEISCKNRIRQLARQHLRLRDAGIKNRRKRHVSPKCTNPC